MPPPQHYDAIVIGSGQGGTPLCQALANAGERVRKRKREIVTSFRSGSERRIAKTKNLDLLYGQASFTGPKSIVVRTAKRGELHFTADLAAASLFCKARRSSSTAKTKTSPIPSQASFKKTTSRFISTPRSKKSLAPEIASQ